MSNIRSASSKTRYVTLFKFVTRPEFAARRSIIRPGVQTTISAPFFISAIWSLIGEPPYAHTAYSIEVRNATGIISDERTNPQIQRFQERLAIAVNLDSKFARRRHDDSNRSFHRLERSLVLDLSKHRQEESDRLTRSGLGNADHITTRHDRGDGLGLNRSRRSVP